MKQRLTHMWKTSKAEFFWGAVASVAIAAAIAIPAAVAVSGGFFTAAALTVLGSTFVHHLVGPSLAVVAQHIFATSALRGIFTRHHTKESTLAERAQEPDEACAPDLPLPAGHAPAPEMGTHAAGANALAAPRAFSWQEQVGSGERAVASAPSYKALVESGPSANHAEVAHSRSGELVGAGR